MFLSPYHPQLSGFNSFIFVSLYLFLVFHLLIPRLCVSLYFSVSLFSSPYSVLLVTPFCFVPSSLFPFSQSLSFISIWPVPLSVLFLRFHRFVSLSTLRTKETYRSSIYELIVRSQINCGFIFICLLLPVHFCLFPPFLFYRNTKETTAFLSGSMVASLSRLSLFINR